MSDDPLIFGKPRFMYAECADAALDRARLEMSVCGLRHDGKDVDARGLCLSENISVDTPCYLAFVDVKRTLHGALEFIELSWGGRILLSASDFSLSLGPEFLTRQVLLRMRPIVLAPASAPMRLVVKPLRPIDTADLVAAVCLEMAPIGMAHPELVVP